MADRESVRLPNKQARFARALAVLIMGVGILLVGVAFIFRTPSIPPVATATSKTAPIPEEQESLADTVAEPSEPIKTETAPTTVSVQPAETIPQPIAEASKPAEEPQSAAATAAAPETVQQEEESPVIARQESSPESETTQQEPVPEPETAQQEPVPEPETVQEEPATKPETVQEEPVAKPETIQQESPSQPETAQQEEPAETPTTAKSEPEQTTAESPPESSSAPDDNAEGWIYAGQFLDGQWLEQGLVIGNELPDSGRNYALNWGANIRATPPGKNTSLSKTIGYLPRGKQIQITEVKKSGNKGHIWLKIKR